MSSMHTKVIRLYRGMMRYGSKLELTDRDYYRRYIKREFKRYENENPTRELVKKRYVKGAQLLKDSMGGVL